MESLIPIDITTINNREFGYVQSIIDALNSVKLDIDAPISEVRKLGDEQMKSHVEVNMK